MLGPQHHTGGIDHSAELDQSNYQPPPTFHFRKRFGEIDWRKLSSVDVDRVARELDFITLQENISTVTFCNIDAISGIDPLISKLLKLAQYTIEYLLHSQEYLQSVMCDCENKLEMEAGEKAALQDQLTEANTEVKKLKVENKKRRKMIQQQQRIIEAGAASYYQCPHCDKAFMNASFLQGHLQRRHPEAAAYIGDVIQHSQKEQTKLGNKLKDLESDLQRERDHFSSKLREAEEDKKRWAAASKAEMDDWKTQEVERWKNEMELMKKSFSEDITKLRIKELEYEKTIVSLKETMHQDQSNLGDLVDDFHEERTKVEAHDGKIQKLEDQLHHKNKQIKLMASDIEQMNEDHTSSLLQQKNKILNEQKRRMQLLERQLKKKEHAAKSQPKPSAKVTIAEPETESEESADFEHDAVPNRSDLKRKYKEQFLQIIPGLVEDNLRKCGVDPNAEGISLKTLTNKLMVLRTERQQKAKNLSNYYPQRQAVVKRVEAELKKKLAGRSPPGKKRGGSSATLPRARSNKPSYHGNQGGSPQRSATLGRVQRSSEPPEVKHTPKRTPGSRKGPTLQSTPKPAVREESKGDDDDLTSWDSIEDIIQPRQQKQPPSTSKQPVNTSKQPVSTSRQPVNTSKQPEANQDDDSYWNSDIEDLLSENENLAAATGQPTKVQQLAGSIEQQLSARKKPPVGAVDLTPNQDAVQVISDEDSFAVSSLEENPKPVPRGQSGVRQSVTTNSSHTLGTSVWGSGSKPPENEGSDWDEDLDLDEILT